MNIRANFFIDLVGLLMAAGIAFSEKGRRARLPEEHLFRHMLTCLMLILAFDMPAWVFDGATFHGARPLLYALDTLYYAFQPIFCFLWMMYADYRSFESTQRLKKLAPLYGAPMLAEIILIVANLWTGWIFIIDDRNTYVRGAYYLANLIPYYAYIVGAVVVTLCGMFGRGERVRRRNRLFLLIMLMPIAGVLIVTDTYGIACDWPLTALALLMIYFDARNRRLLEQQVKAAMEAEKAARLEAELTQTRVAVMLSQIQPHFLYNALNTIKCLCDRKDDRASAAVADFAKFLRGNMDSLKATAPIPFTRELEHVKRYLTIENLRFPEIAVAFDIRADDFCLPALTLQPLVENAIRYAFPSGAGTVTVSTWADQKHACVRVADDGVGYDPWSVQYDGRSHVGIENTRDRLRAMCGGELTVESAPGAGTTVTVTLPKEG